MAENKTKATAEDVAAFIEKSDPKKVTDSFKLIKIMERLSGEKATMWGRLLLVLAGTITGMPAGTRATCAV